MLLTSHWPLLSTQLSYMEQVNTILLYCGSLRLAVKPTPFFSRVLGWDSARMPAHPPGPTPPSPRTQRKVTGQSLSMLISYHSPVDTPIILFICGEWEIFFWYVWRYTSLCMWHLLSLSEWCVLSACMNVYSFGYEWVWCVNGCKRDMYVYCFGYDCYCLT